MKCNTYITLATISIILIISIAILVLYKNYEDNPTSLELFISQTDAEKQIIANNNQINLLMNQFNANNIGLDNTLLGDQRTPETIDFEFQNNVASNINTVTSLLSSNYTPKITANSNLITNLENSLTDLENMISNMNLDKNKKKNYTHIKSFNNGMEMKLSKSRNNYQVPETGSNVAAYLVNVNNGCLSVGANDYDVYQCNDNNVKQLFTMKNILNENDYSNNIDKALPFDNVDKTKISYPFAMMKSVNNDNCLTNNHGTLTVQPCYSFVAQRWMPMEN
uniref:Uncharacterized protein n=1 Tax=viral metagenome TaxID=1070528 RepID=A0A6C0EZU5_9ZZZZ